MIHSLISLHSYLILNGAIAIGFILSRLVLSIPFFTLNISYGERLKFSRYSFLMTIVLFFIVPHLLSIFPSNYHSNLQLVPILKNASVSFLNHHQIYNDNIDHIGPVHSFLLIQLVLIIIFLTGTILFFTRYIHGLFVLNKIRRNSFCQHKINNISILVSLSADIPFCWSFFKSHFIVIPNIILEKHDEFNLIIQHELQHIRQGDTYWLHLLTLIKSFCFWNPFVKLWINWIDELQEFSCDESLVLRRKILPTTYAQCLLDVASDTLKNRTLPQGVLGIHRFSNSILYRRINMLFNYKTTYKSTKLKKISLITAYVVSIFATLSTAYALNGPSSLPPLSKQQIASIIEKSHLDKGFQVLATPEVVSEINNIRSSEEARTFKYNSLQRMKHYQPIIQKYLSEKHMPTDLLVIPLVESGYRPLDQSKNPVHAAGIWQFIPSTAKHFGLTVNDKRDDRLNTGLSTKAALDYLQQTHDQFGNWKLAFVAYEIGEKNTDRLIKETHSRDAWALARSPHAPQGLKKIIAMFDAALIIMHNPSLIESHT